LLGVAAAGFVLTRRHVAHPAAATVLSPTQSAKPQNVPEVTAPAPAATVKVVLRSNPATARLFLDDQPLEGNPAQEVLPQGDRVHILRAELSGHRTASAQFATTKDDTVEVTLEKIATDRNASKRSGAATTPVTGRQAAASNNDCAQPFFVGPDGIKKIKPKCL